MNRFDKLRESSKKSFEEYNNEADKLKVLSDDAKRVAKISKNAGTIIRDLDDEFTNATKLTKFDVEILFVAVAMQCTRQLILNALNKRTDDKTAAKKVKGGIKEKSLRQHRFYQPSLQEIISSPVPFDTVFGAKKFDLGLSGLNHRIKTLGHDPLLGLIFGTANIATSTITINPGFESYHVITGQNQLNRSLDKIAYRANTYKVFEYTKNAILFEGKEGKEKIAYSLVKEVVHLASDVQSTSSLPLPGISALSVETAQSLATWGLDFGNAIKFGEQAVFCELINSLVGYYHMLFYDRSIDGSKKLYMVRTRKIIRYSNIISSLSNVICVAFSTLAGIETINKRAITKSLGKLDVGGFLITVYRILNDRKFKNEIKKEFIKEGFKDVVMGDLDSILL